MAETSGEISQFNAHFEWRIPDFCSQYEKSDNFCTSPRFLAGHDVWTIGICPDLDHSPQFTSLFLRRLTTNGETFANYTLAIKMSDGSLDAKQRGNLFSKENDAWGWCHFIQRSEILSEKYVMEPGNVLTVSCTICSEPLAGEPVWEILKPEYLSNGGPPTGPKVLWESLSCNLKDLFLSHTKSDIILKVRGEEFPVHRTILRARSAVFAEMLEQNTVENLSGVIEISDANPAIFRDLLLFMYSGEVKKLSSENMYDLCALSDKYKLKDLKEECRRFMKRTSSVDNVSDVHRLAEKYNSSSKAGTFCTIV